MPQYAAGIRIEPPVSVPSAWSQTPAATSAAEPLLDPPDVRLGVARVERHPVRRVDAARGVLEQVRLAEELGAGRAEPGDDRSRRASAGGGTPTVEAFVVTTPRTSMLSLTATGDAVQRARRRALGRAAAR